MHVQDYVIWIQARMFIITFCSGEHEYEGEWNEKTHLTTYDPHAIHTVVKLSILFLLIQIWRVGFVYTIQTIEEFNKGHLGNALNVPLMLHASSLDVYIHQYMKRGNTARTAAKFMWEAKIPDGHSVPRQTLFVVYRC